MRSPSASPPAVALIEVYSFGASLLVLDQVEKTAGVRVLQAELNDNYGLLLKFTGSTAAVRIAGERAREVAGSLQAAFTAKIISAPDPGAWAVIESPAEYQSLLGQDVVLIPRPGKTAMTKADNSSAGALGLIETQGFTAATAATDAACKAAGVRVIAKEKLGGGYITVIFEGDVAGVTAAVAAGRQAAEAVGKLIAAHVIARPSEGVGLILSRL